MSAVGDLRRETEAARALLAACMLDLENDQVLTRDMIEAETDLHEAIRGAIARIVALHSLRDSIEATIGTLKARLDRFYAHEANIRAAMLTAMEVAGLPRFETPLGTVSRKAVPPSVIITDEAAVPDEFCKFKREISKTAVKMALASGATVPGVEMSNGGVTIAIKLS